MQEGFYPCRSFPCFTGSLFRLYLLDNKHHHMPHIHAKYAESEASIGIGDGEVLSGELPRK